MASDEPRRPRIRQTAPVVIDTTGPVTIQGVIAYDAKGNPIGRVGVKVDADKDSE